MKRLIRLLLVSFALGIMQASAPPDNLYLRDISRPTELPATGDYVYIDSPGGEINRAFELASQVQGKTCIVFRAASAALMIILPACKERYFVKGALFVFHSASIFIPPFQLQGVMLSQWELEEIAIALSKDNERILRHMINNKVPFSEAWLKKQMQENTELSGEALRHWYPWARPVAECLHCPDWTKLVVLLHVTNTP